MANLHLTNPKLGNANVSSLVKSAQTLASSLADYQDKVQADNYKYNPTDDQLAQYSQYLKQRIGTLQASGTIANVSKALSLNDTMISAVKSNQSFNLNVISGQILAGNASDQDKLTYLNTAFTQAQSIGDTTLMASIQDKAYNLQQSIAYHAQAQQTANETAYNAQQAAVKAGYENEVSMLQNDWANVKTAFTNPESTKVPGGANLAQSLKAATANLAPVLKAYGITMPKNLTGTLAGVALGNLYGQIAYYNNAAQALGPDTTDGQAMQAKAQAILSGDTKISTPYGDQNLFDVLKTAYSPNNNYSASVNAQGGVSESANAVIGYHNTAIQTPFGSVQVAMPLSSGNSESAYTSFTTNPDGSANKDAKSNIDKQLQKLGFNPQSGTGGFVDKSGEIKVQLSDKALQWLNPKGNLDLKAGDKVTLVPTAGGYQLLSTTNSLYGISFDSKGLPGLFAADANNNYHLVGGQYGFNPHSTVGLQNIINSAQFAATQRVGAEKAAAAKLQLQLAATHTSTANFPSIAGVPKPGALQGGAGPSAYQTTNRGAQMAQRAGGGFNFTNNGQAISAARYAQITNTPFRSLLQSMANQGDTGAKSALNFVGNDFGYNPNAIGGNGNLYNSLTYGTGHQFTGASAPNVQGGQLTLPSGLKL